MVQFQSLRMQRITSILHDDNLSHKSRHPDDYKQNVPLQSIENVLLTVDFPRIEFIEQSHHNESVENSREMLSGFVDSSFGETAAVLDIKKHITYQRSQHQHQSTQYCTFQ